MNWGYVHIALWNRFLKSQLNVENERERDSGRERKILTERERERQWEIRVRERHNEKDIERDRDSERYVWEREWDIVRGRFIVRARQRDVKQEFV